jgi:hypothetical protein
MDLEDIVGDIAAALVAIDPAARHSSNSKPVIGRYGEPQLLKEVAKQLSTSWRYESPVRTK